MKESTAIRRNEKRRTAMKRKMLKRMLSFAMVLLCVLPLGVPLASAQGSEEVVLGTHDFEALPLHSDYVSRETSSALAPGFGKIVEGNGGKVLRLPILCTDTSDTKVTPTNRGRLFRMAHDAFPTTGRVSIKVDVYMHGVKGTTPNIGFWLRKVGYTNVSGAAAMQEWYHLIDIDLLTGESIFTKVNGSRVEGASALKQNAWNTIEIIWKCEDGSFDIYFNDELYARCVMTVCGDKIAYRAD